MPINLIIGFGIHQIGKNIDKIKVLGKVSSGQETPNLGRVPMKDGKSHGGSLQPAQKQDHLPKTVDELRKMFLHNAARHNAMQHSVILQIRAKKVPCRGLYLYLIP